MAELADALASGANVSNDVWVQVPLSVPIRKILKRGRKVGFTMGQYYKPLLIADDGTKQTAYSHDYGNGLKLMEHSWVGNNFVNAVLQNLDSNPQRLAWVGDYADSVSDEDCHFGDGYIDDRDTFMKLYKALWSDEDVGETVTSIDKSQPEYKLSNEEADCFIVNLTKKCYIDMEKYVAENKKKDGDYFWCINPLPLLTSIGNGQGGGDYRGDDPEVGTWAFDKIYVSALRPGNMEEVMYYFHE